MNLILSSGYPRILAAIFETILGHIDLSKRKIVNFPEDKLMNLINVSESQRKESNLSFEVKLFIKDIDGLILSYLFFGFIFLNLKE